MRFSEFMRTRRRVGSLGAVAALAIVMALAVPAVSAAPTASGIHHRNVPVCASPSAGQAACLSILHEAVTTDGKPAPNATSPTGLSPATIKDIYGFDTSNSAGSSQTIAIVDAYDAPTIAEDLNTFSSQYGLPACTTDSGCFTKVNQTGGTGSYPRSDAGWALEISLDVEWAHAVAPGAKILLVEANSNRFSDLLAAEGYAGAHASYVSNSWGGPEFSGEHGYDSYFQHSGVSYFASSGDAGLGAEYPSASPNVISVGGTSLDLSAYSTGAPSSVIETGWNDSGGGCSAYETANPAQVTDSVSCRGMRATPDVALDADPYSGVSVYDSTRDHGQLGWFTVGGTSASAPMWAARSADAGAVVDAAYVYANNKISFHDVTSGNNGASALVGYDLVTGRGSWDDGSVINTSSGGGTSQTVVHVPDGGIDYAPAPHGHAMLITVTVEDSQGNPVGGAMVSITVSGPVSGSGSKTTGSDGTATFRLNRAPSGTYDTTINDITGTNLIWEGGIHTYSAYYSG